LTKSILHELAAVSTTFFEARMVVRDALTAIPGWSFFLCLKGEGGVDLGESGCRITGGFRVFV
jgi:hypothetical protein